ncbi:hypothetical protein M885DRAFT_619333 [Pelagophyceae sp. CCMP2097]|nr:hypothetical protein M885DRAFT_619333 [Pelagophyceae sp. CCMP2097]|mmetsp:Transcript_29645/g.99792  ORF Transcript_29645/g.99792 Transcript_29645/m.99792 type:complete len:135 (-) Transcript_29645:63-467(-)|eukprot:CAMPEP_0206811898 /NCGR_PEP_ID=MMETSP0975-20121206/7491_1 /ASSEMBLY_ACC=CAM_ASM_000399 /TAXON_ID=483370 /ORGANISM="non described non described, Strain CCMP2097" /LENGTH=134 /DNA_ID=CAMNT_0054354027 /DNA_START=45 /DNA_END=449 /DNA_ORIENTATION=-
MARKNSIAARKGEHEMRLKREEEIKAKAVAKTEKRLAKDAPPKVRLIPKNLVRGASKNGRILESAKAEMKARKAAARNGTGKSVKPVRSAPKSTPVKPDGTAERRAAASADRKEKRAASAAARRAKADAPMDAE